MDATLGPWRLVEPLGSGGMGTVWRAEAPDGRLAAVKTLRPGADAASRRALRREVAALRRLSHPAIPRVLGHDAGADEPWVAMELVAGEPLSSLFARTSCAGGSPTWTGEELDPPETTAPSVGADRAVVVGILARVARILAWVHGEGLVHRDLKPANVLLRADGSPVLVDFGLGAFAGGSERADVPIAAGTPAYMSPEQLRAEPVDGRSDLYALGCMLYEALTGAPPFLGPFASVLAGHLRDPPPPLREDVPPELAALVRRLLAKRPEDRPAHAADVADALGAPSDAVPVRLHLPRPRFRGREDEIERLTDGPPCAFVVGDPGVGKTRLAIELVHRRPRAVRALTVSAREPGGLLAGLVTALGDAAPAGPPPTLAGRDPVEGATERARWMEAMGDALEANGPLLCVLDDLADADDAALSFLQACAVRRWTGVRIVGLARSDAPPRLLALAADAGPPLHLPPLPVADLDAIAAEVLSLPTPPEPLLRRLRASATPPDVLGCLQALVETGRLSRSGGRWVVGELGEIPTTPEALARWRIELLSEPSRRLAEALAVLDRHSTFEALEAALGEDPADALAELRRRHLLDDDALRLASASVRAAVLSVLTAARHAEVAGCALRTVQDAPAEVRLGWAEAADRRPEARAAAREALVPLAGTMGALPLLERLARVTDAPGERAGLHLDRARILAVAGRTDDARAELARAEALGLERHRVAAVIVRTTIDWSDAEDLLGRALATATDGDDRARLHDALARHLFLVGRLPEALAHVEAGIAVAGDDRERARLTCMLASILYEHGDLQRCDEMLRASLPLLTDPPRRLEALRWYLALRSLAGDVDVEPVLLEVLALARQLGAAAEEVTALNALGGATLHQPERAVRWFERTIEVARAAGRDPLASLGNLAVAEALAGRHADASRTITEAVAEAKARGATDSRVGRLLVQHSRIATRGGDPQGALRTADEALERLRRADDRLWLPYALAQRGHVELGLGRSAAAWLAEARALAGDEPALLRDLRELELAERTFRERT